MIVIFKQRAVNRPPVGRGEGIFRVAKPAIVQVDGKLFTSHTPLNEKDADALNDATFNLVKLSGGTDETTNQL